MSSRDRGFVPAWFMDGAIVLAIVGIGLSLVIPAAVAAKARSDVSQALRRAQPAMDSVSAFFIRAGRMPHDNAEVGAAQLRALEGGSVRAIEVREGVIAVELTGGFGVLVGKSLLVRPAVTVKDSTRPVRWVCQDGPAPDGWTVTGQGPLVNQIKQEYLPQSCRQQ